MDSCEEARKTARPINRDEVIWSGHVYGYAGYAKMNREILLRIASSRKVKLASSPSNELGMVDGETRRKLDAIRAVQVSATATWVRGYTPRREYSKGRRICFTMMETQTVHPDFVRSLNCYDECWTPTSWNRETFRASGVSIPINVVPLGVNPEVFKPDHPGKLPEAELLSTKRIGAKEIPGGFVFVTMYQPTFRKGLPILLEAFATAFANDPEAALILATTIHSYGNVERELAKRCSRARVYGLRGTLSEKQLANLFCSSHAYVSASVGEGWNLPLCEAAACGIPVVAGRHTAHAEILSDETAYLFDPQGYSPIPGSEKVCHWYENQPFARFGKDSIHQLATLFKNVKSQYAEAKTRAASLSQVIRTRYSWDASARAVHSFLEQHGRTDP
jgi:glycosyltransferase involved in cell wall biosynthesis